MWLCGVWSDSVIVWLCGVWSDSVIVWLCGVWSDSVIVWLCGVWSDSLDYGAVNTCTGRNGAYGTDSLYREGLRREAVSLCTC